jgi:hypothetical protein
MTKQIVCMKWGAAYGAEYVNRLYRMIERNITGPFRLVCLTDDDAGIIDAVDCFPCPTIDAPPPYDNRPWRKVSLWGERVADLEGEVLFLDLDLVIVDSLDPFFDYGEGFCVIYNWTQPGLKVGNTSVYRFTVGSRTELLERFTADPMKVIKTFGNSQTYVTRNVGDVTFWPDAWCKSFKVHCIPRWPLNWLQTPRLPEGARVIAFTGTPNPPDAIAGEWPAKQGAGWHKKLYQHVRPTPWIDEHWK